MESNKERGPLTSRYLAALFAPLGIAGMMQVTWPFFQNDPVLPYFLAIIFCAWYGRLGPALLSVVFSFLLADFFFMEPYLSLWLLHHEDLIRLLQLATVGLVISWLGEFVHRERQLAKITLDATNRAEEAIREKERFVNQIAELSPVVINVLDLATRRHVYVSNDVVSLLGYTPQEILAMEDPLAALCHPEDIPQANEELVRLKHAKDGEITELEYRMRRRDGEWRWLASRIMPFERDQHGVVRQIVTSSLDITERKRIEEAQRQSQRQYETLLQSIDGIVWEADPQTLMFTFLSRQAERILGYPLGQWFEGPTFWLDHMHPDDRDWAVAFCDDATNRRVDHRFEYRMIAADGHVVWLSDIVTVHVVDDQSVLLRGVMVDITERKRIEEKLRQSESQLAEAQRLASLGSWNWELRNNTHTWSDELYHISGLHPHESPASYEAFIELVHPDDRSVISGAIQHGLRTREPINSYLRIIRPDGAERVIHSRGNIISDISGTVIRMHGTLQDVTERKQAEEALRQAEQKYRDIFENASEGVFQTTPEGRFVAANPALARMLGFDSPEDLISTRTDIAQEHYVDPQSREEFKRLMEENGLVHDFEREVYRKEGSKIWISENVRTVRDQGGTIIYYEGTTQDVTGRRRAEEALRESEERYRDLVENSLDLICTHDLNGLILSANRAAMELMGYSSGSYAGGTNFREILAPEVRDQFDDYLKRIRTDGVASGLMLVQTRTGEKRIWEYYNTLRTEGVSAPVVRGMARDITDRRRAEEALRASEERYRELFENAKDAIYVQDLNGRYTSVNRAAEKLSGYTREEIIGKHFENFVAPEFLPQVCANWAKKLADQEQTAYEVEVVAKNGHRVPVELCSGLIFKNGVPVGIQGIARDITERKRAEDDLKQQKEILQKIVDHIPVMIRLSGPNGDVQLINREYERTTGWSLAEIQKNNLNIFAELYPDQHERQVIIDRVAAATGEWADCRTRVRDGRVIDTSWTNINLSAGMSLGIGQDISDRKRAEETLRSYSRQLIEAQESERQHIARELHDQIGQVLTAIRINLQTIGKSPYNAESRPLIDQGVSLIDAALEQVRNLCFELRPSLLDNLGLVAALRWYSDQYTQRTGIRARSVTNLPEGQTRLRQELETACFRIVQEALTNVVRHANAKNVSIDLRRLDHKTILSIKDDGIGFDNLSPNGGDAAIRLGLRGMKERALALGGTLEIESAPAQGTEIRACFPTGSNGD